MLASNKKIYLLAYSALPDFSAQDLKDRFSELKIIGDLELIVLSQKPAADTGAKDWVGLAKAIYSRQDQALGFVVLSGVDNILPASAAAGFMLGAPAYPVVFTGGFCQPDDDKKTEVRANLINAVQVVRQMVPGVSLMFGNRILRASQSRFSDDISLNVFTAPNPAILGRIDFSVRLNEGALSLTKSKVRPSFDLKTNIRYLPIAPLADNKPDLAGQAGLMIDAGCRQQLPGAVLDLIAGAAKKMPVLVFSEKPGEVIDAPSQAILCNYLTRDTALVKFMWALGQAGSKKEVQALMAKDIAGEVIK